MADGIAPGKQIDAATVFVVHGRDETARNEMFSFLRSIGLRPLEWSQAVRATGKGSPYIGEVLDVAFAMAQAVVVLFTPDEIAYIRSEHATGEDDPDLTPAAQPRPNVLFEAGIATGRDSSRTILVQLGDVRPFSDIAGKHVVRLDDSALKRKELAQRLATAGCPADTSGEDWLRPGAFTVPAPPGGGLPLGKKEPPVQRKRIRLDLRFHHRKNGGRLEIINTGAEDIFDLDLKLPPEAVGFELMDRRELPLRRLPSGKSAMILAFRSHSTGEVGRDHFDVRVTGRTADGQGVSEDVFLSVAP